MILSDEIIYARLLLLATVHMNFFMVYVKVKVMLWAKSVLVQVTLKYIVGVWTST